jgi:alpha-tubulin suppressor-like RCC1 family protein
MQAFDHKAHMIAGGKNHTLILTVNGLVYGCGSNLEGQLGC